jgi:hypoxanthine-DNA glycosylase
VKHCFPPLADARTRLLVLGSLPGEESLAQARYYANPRNQFWRLIGKVVSMELTPLDYEARLAALLEAQVGLWDVIGSATRAGSLDTAIRDASANDLQALVATLPRLRAVAFNGGKAAAMGEPLLAGSGLQLVRLPSSSPALTWSYERKLAEWLRLRPFLSG